MRLIGLPRCAVFTFLTESVMIASGLSAWEGYGEGSGRTLATRSSRSHNGRSRGIYGSVGFSIRDVRWRRGDRWDAAGRLWFHAGWGGARRVASGDVRPGSGVRK